MEGGHASDAQLQSLSKRETTKRRNIWRADFRDRIRPLLKRCRRRWDVLLHQSRHSFIYSSTAQNETKKGEGHGQKKKCVQKLNSILFVSAWRGRFETTFSGYKDTQRQWHVHTHTHTHVFVRCHQQSSIVPRFSIDILGSKLAQFWY